MGLLSWVAIEEAYIVTNPRNQMVIKIGTSCLLEFSV